MAGVWLATMTALRLGTYLVFNQEQLSWAQAAPAFALGLRFDLRVTGCGLLGLLVLGGLPGLDPFRSAGRRRGWIGVLTLWHVALATSAFAATVFLGGWSMFGLDKFIPPWLLLVGVVLAYSGKCCGQWSSSRPGTLYSYGPR